MQTLVIGANGKIGRRLCAEAAKAGHPVRAMVRDPAQCGDLEALGVSCAVGDLEGDFASALDGCDQVVFTAGSGPHTGLDKTLLVDLWGAVRAVDAARAAGVRHFVMVSAMRADDPLAGPEALRPYLVAKRAADLHLEASDLVHTLLLPGRLTDDPGTGRIRTRPEDGEGITITRGDVAAAILHVLRHPPERSRRVVLLQGETPIAAALGT